MQWSFKKNWAIQEGLLWSKYILVNTKKQIFYTVVESILSYCWEIWTQDYKLEKKHLSTEMDIWWRAVRTSRLLKVRKEVIREKMRITLIILEVQKRNTMFLFSMTLLVYSGNTVLLQVWLLTCMCVCWLCLVWVSATADGSSGALVCTGNKHILGLHRS